MALQPIHDNEIIRLHALGRSDKFIADATGLSVNSMANIRARIGLPAIPKDETTDWVVDQPSPAYLRWLAAKEEPGGIQKLLQDARAAFLEDNEIMIQIAEDAAEAYRKANEDD